MPYQTSAGNNAPVVAPTVTVGNEVLSSPQAVYQAFKAQRKELSRQMDGLESTRRELSTQLQDPAVTGADKKGLESRITDVDGRISNLQKQMSDADAQVAKSAAVPGAAIELPEPPRTGPPDEAWVLGGLFIVCAILPLSIAFARRIWKRGGQVIAAFPKEIAERMSRMEQVVEATQIEVERIGEGQRFMTKVLTENPTHSLSVGAAQQAAFSPPGDIRR
ncbi:MAG: hypothetical protein ABIQ55_12035 [Gemmatimonadaceae bacterium]